MPSRQERLTQNQKTVRGANERLEEAVEARVDGRGTVPFLCECADIDCTDRIEMTTSDYTAAHIDRHMYVLVAGHATVDGEEMVDDLGGYLVMRKN